MSRLPRFWWALPAILLITLTFVQFQNVGTELRYDQFIQMVRDGEIKTVTLANDQISAERHTPTPQGRRVFNVSAPEFDSRLLPLLEEKHVEVRVDGHQNTQWLMWIWLLVPLFFLFSIFGRMSQPGGGSGGVLSFGKSRGETFTEQDISVTFKDVAGVVEAKQELAEVIDFLKSPDKYRSIGARIPKGILLVGPPGTGKTLLARAVAGEAGVPFISISGSEFVEMFVGVGAARVRDLFEQATKAAPAIVFIDELDALGRARGPGNVAGSNEEREQTLNQLLVELDGFEPLGEAHGPVVILASTNRPEVLDPALLRAGRFDRQVVVDRPDKQGRRQILDVHVRKVPLDSDVELDEVAARSPGLSGADLSNLVNEAALRAAREGRKSVSMEDFSHAQDRVLAGLEQRSRLIDPLERRRVAFHECGHAIAGHFIGTGSRIHKVSIVPRSIGALGFTMQLPEHEQHLFTPSQLRARIVSLLGGRAAEELVFGEPSTGAADDLRKATDIARAMVLEHGLSDAVGPVAVERRQNVFLGGMPAASDVGGTLMNNADTEIRRLLDASLADAKNLLQEHRAELDGMVKDLLELEVLEGERLERWLPTPMAIAAQ